uniref:Bifunctional endo-1,4-beta-xylanase xylA n=1 Tax=Solanum tuberosum TaxID=4113 RepID=M1DQL7_SOLTU
MDGGITGGKESGELRTQATGVYEKTWKGNFSPPLDTHLSDISSNLEGGNTNNNQTTQPNEVVMNLSKGTSRKDHDTVRNGSFPHPAVRKNDQLSVIHTSGAPAVHEEANQIQEMSMNIQQANVQTKRNQTAESSAAEAQSSNLSFGIRGQDIGERRLDQQQKNGQTSQNRQIEGKEVKTGHKDKEWQKSQHKEAIQQGGTSRTQQDNTRANMEYQHNFPRISNNFARYDPNPQKSKNVNNQISNNVAQELQATDNEEEGNNNRTAGQGSHPMQGSNKDPSLINSHNETTRQKEQAATTKNNNTSGRVQETHTNLQEGVSKGGRELTHVLHEIETYDHMTDSKAPATPISNQKEAAQHAIQERKEMNTETEQQKERPNNKSGGRLSKKKRDAMKKRQGKSSELEQVLTDKGQQLKKQIVNNVKKGRPIQDDYGALNSEDELEPDNQSIDEYDEEEEETSNLLIQAFGSTFNTDWSEVVQELTEQQGLSPRGRKQSRHTKQSAITSISGTSSRPITRSKSKGF